MSIIFHKTNRSCKKQDASFVAEMREKLKTEQLASSEIETWMGLISGKQWKP